MKNENLGTLCLLDLLLHRRKRTHPFLIVLFMVIGMIMGTVLERAEHECPDEYKMPMTITEFQTWMNATGYDRWDCGTVGKIGPKTKKAWGNYSNDRSCDKDFQAAWGRNFYEPNHGESK